MPTSLGEVLGRPVSDIADCPVVRADEVKLVAADLEALLKKCLYCVRFRLAVQLDVFLSVVGQATALQPERIVRGLSQPAEEGTCLDLFCEVAAQMLARVNAPLRLDVDVEQLFEVVQAVCGDVKLKDKVGGVLGKLLLDYMHDSTQHMDDYRVHRGCASALITLLRGSAANKNRFSAECGRIASCLEFSSDFFFQMQCVEGLFRLHAHNRTVLAQAKMSDHLRRGITSLPNDATLLLSIQNFLDSYNAEFNAERVVPFTIVRMEIDGAEVYSHTTMYFSPLLLVVLLPGGTGDNFTVPFEHIRSVKLSKDHRLGLRLNVVPPKLALLMNLEEEGKDTLHVFLTQSTLARLRSCHVHQWIADRKRNAPRRVVRQAPSQVSQQHQQQQQQQYHSNHSRNEEEEAEEEEAVEKRPVHSARGSRAGGGGSSSRAASTHAASAVLPITERQPNRPSPRKTARATPTVTTTTTTSARERVNEEEEEEDDGGADSRLAEVHHAAAVKAARYREQQLEHLQGAADGIQAELEAMRRQSARDRDGFEAVYREDMAAIRHAEAALKESAAGCVQSLNAELEDVQALGALLKAEADKLRERLAKSLGKSEGVEEACLVRIKRLVDTQMVGLEGDLTRVLVDANPLSDVSDYLGQRMAELASADSKPKARRLEYS